ncbi:MAG: hypothetical protein IT160_10605 [Bryobacterales bacterium]|nr:hypothetical protein [Bryobacterales bacterium]
MDRSDQARLDAEVRYLHDAFFSRPLAAEVVDRYIRAVRHCGLDEDRTAEKIVRSRLDAEAVEFALRLRGRGVALTRKIRILFYLVEVRSDYYADFVNETPLFGRALWRLAASLARTAWKLVKGSWLVWRHGFG